MSSNPVEAAPQDLPTRGCSTGQVRGNGRLCIFLGYAAGVGKTYAMLESARARLAEGQDIVVGIVETHGRAETASLLDGLEIVPSRRVENGSVTLTEMDVDAVLTRHPQAVVVDELAHSNAPGARHAKRYQDVEELVAAGIDVYATLNVQHLESLNDVVAQITGIVVRETLPDRVLDSASEIDLIDLSPDELLQRLREGKVYVPEQAARAMDKFFRQGNLNALREIALRRTAARVDDQMRAYMDVRSIRGPWPATERLLVCVSPGALSERLVRTGHRLAGELRAEWFAIYVETADHANLSPAERERIARLLHMAEEMGAKVVTLPGSQVAETIIDYAHAHNITKIIAGKHVRARWIELWRGSVVDQVIRSSGSIDVYVISSDAQPVPPERPRARRPHAPWRYYALGVGLVVVVTLLGIPIGNVIAPANLVVFYLLAVVISAMSLGRGPSILTALLGVLALDFFFVPPHFTFAVADTQYLLTFMGLMTVSVVISTLTGRVRGQAETAQRRELQTMELYEFSRDLAAAFGLDEILNAIVVHVGQTFWRQAVVLLPQANGAEAELEVRATSRGWVIDANDRVVATWTYRRGEPAGYGTGTLAAAAIRCIPLKTVHGVVGVLGIKPLDPSAALPQEQRRLLESFASQAALAIERAQFAEEARQTQVLQATEKLQTALLNSISHDLRTPLVSITGTLSSLQDEAVDLDEATRRSMVETAYGEAQRLNHLVGNLLDITRIEGGAMSIRQTPCDVQDAIGSALDRLAIRLQGRQVTVALPELPLVPMDFVLIVQVLVNIVENACKYSAPDTPVEIDARVTGADLCVRVLDRGIGIPAEDLDHVFDKFYRVARPDGVAGTGLGLSICRGIVEAHHGRIYAENRPGGGTIVNLTLPLGLGG